MVELIRLAAEFVADPYEPLVSAPPPTERLEADICQLAGNIAAAECRFLILVGEYDARGAWASWDMPSCAAWLAWKCQLSPGTAREHVRVARALRVLPVIRSEFAAGRMSYSKARALTRIATPATEQGLTELTRSMTAGQVERFAQAHQRCTDREDNEGSQQLARTKLSWWINPDTGELRFSGYLPADKAAVVLQALRTATMDASDSRQQPEPVTADQRPEPLRVTAASMADALTEIAGAYLRGKIVSADNADVYQVIVHTTPEALTAPPAGVPAGTQEGDVPAGTCAGHPARPDRCHLEDSHSIPAWQAQKITCMATLQVMLHEADGNVLTIGRRSRRPTARIRKAVRERDHYRCVFPGCNNRRTDLHHIIYWSNGGETSTDNLCLLCDTHHTLVHLRGYIITRTPGGYTCTSPDGTVLEPAGQLPGSDSDISATHDADITPMTIYPPFSGERLDLHLAIWIALANARNQEGSLPTRAEV